MEQMQGYLHTNAQQCSGSTSGTTWYSLPATEGSQIYNLTTSFNSYTNFNTTVSLYNGDCKNLQCVATSSGGYISAMTTSGIYYIAVSGASFESGKVETKPKKNKIFCFFLLFFTRFQVHFSSLGTIYLVHPQIVLNQ